MYQKNENIELVAVGLIAKSSVLQVWVQKSLDYLPVPRVKMWGQFS